MSSSSTFLNKTARFLAVLIAGISLTLPFLATVSDAQGPKISQESVDLLTRTGRAMAEVTAAVKPGIVNILTTRTVKVGSGQDPFLDDPFFKRFFGDQFGRQKQQPREQKSSGLGSGVIVSPEGYIITNSHVVKDADEIKVTLTDKREFIGKIIGSDLKTEIAVVKIDATGLPTVPWGNSDKVQVGEVVLAVGNPFGLNQTVTMGIVSALGRANVGIADYEDFIQTDAAINPGNSGGALVNVKGEVVGINTAIYSTSGGYQGIGFAIPSNMVKSIMESLIKKGKVVRGWLGVSIQKITPDLAKQFDLKDEVGALVGDVVEDGPAEKAGLQRGDIIFEYDGKKIEEPSILRNMVANTLPGEQHTIKVLRDGKARSMTITIGELPSDAQHSVEAGDFQNALKGVSVQDMNPELAKKLKVPDKIKGVIISDVEENSVAAGALIQGDVIQEVNRKRVPDVKSYKDVVAKIKKEESVLLLIFRGGSSLFVTLSQK
ncbi:MAG: DegQ family serine endoprotease [Nitrospirae bacterium]|nr:DegQ family serine endoprotease [Nitrospirota bacterium]